MWTKETLHQFVAEKMGNYHFVVVSNREPYVHEYFGDEIKCVIPASGVAIALDPVMQACGGTWIAYGSGAADREVVDSDDCIQVPPKEPRYILKRVWLSKEEVNRYYYGFSNEGLWPLCHIAYTRPQFVRANWEAYKAVNQKFAEVVLKEIRRKKVFIFIQDYHFSLLPAIIKKRNPNCIIAQFWHIPWPNREVFRVCPWQQEVLNGLLGNDLLGFHLRYHCMNFLDTVERSIESKVDYEKFDVIKGGRSTLVRAYPISVDFEKINRNAQKPEIEEEMVRLRSQFGLKNQIVILGVDRIDYTKGIPERLRAMDLFFEKYPQYLGKVTFVQAGVLSRIHIQKYKELNDELNKLIEEINFKYQNGYWRPICFNRANYEKRSLLALYRLADVCIVSSLHDGMNLVAKEYISTRYDKDGVLILSQFTGASRELQEAIMINPYSIDDMADAIKQAIEMSPQQRRKRMSKLRQTVRQNNIYRWAGKILSELLKFEFRE